MAAYALGVRRQRARQAGAENIRRGHWRWEGPVGVVRPDANRSDKRPALQVPQAVHGVVQTVRDLGSARQTMLWSRAEQLPLPEGHPATAGRDLLWRLPTGHRINQMRLTPCYAGALAYGRTEAKTVLEDGRARPTTRRKKPRDPWRMLRRDTHPGSRSWAACIANQQPLEVNGARPKAAAGGAAKQGPAWLSGWLRCGHGGRNLHVGYSGHTGRIPRYICPGGRVDRGASSCRSLGGVGVEQAVAAAVREALQPAGVHAA